MTKTVACWDAFDLAMPLPASAAEETAAFSEQKSIVAFHSRPADWLEQVRNDIESLLEVPNDWDSYGARAVDRESVKRALAVVHWLSHVVGVPGPTVTATPDGDVGLCWDEGTWSLDVSVDPTGLLSYVFLDETDSQRDQEARTRDVRDLVFLVTKW